MKNILSSRSGLLIKKSIRTLLCLLQIMPFQGLAGRPDVDQALTQEDGRALPIRSYGVRALDNRYHLSFQLTDQDKSEPIFFHDEGTGLRLGQAAYLGETLHLTWHRGALSLDGSNIPSSLKEVTVHSQGAVECGDAALPNTHFSFFTPSFVGRGNFLAQSIFVDSPSSTNFGIMDALALTIRGGVFHGHEGSTTLGRVRFDVEISGDYLMEGAARSLYQTIHAHNASFEDASSFSGVYLDLNTTRAAFAPTAQFTLLTGVHLRTQRSLTLKGHFDIQSSSDALGHFFGGLLGHTLDDDQRTALTTVTDMARQKIHAPLSAASDARLIQLADITLHEGNVELTGKRVDVEGTMSSHSHDSKLRVGSTTLIRVASSHLLPHMSLKAPNKLIVRALHLESLTSKAGGNAPSTLAIGPGVTATIGTWESSQEEIVSSGDVDLQTVTLRSPQKVAFTQLTTNQLKVRDDQGDVYMVKLILNEKASIKAKKGELLVSELIAPDAVFQAVGDRITLLSAPQAGTIDVSAMTQDVTITKAVAKVLKACAPEGHLEAQDITSDTAALQGTTVSLGGHIGGADLTIAATQGNVVSSATLDHDASLNLTTDTMDLFRSAGSLRHLGLTTTRLSGTHAWLEGRQSLRPESLSLIQTSDSLINLEEKSITIASSHVHLETPGPLEMLNTRLKAPGSLSLSAGSADLDFAHITAEEFHLKVKENLSAQGVQIRGVRALEVVAKTVKGAALKKREGNWNYEYDVLTARPEFICENGPLVVLAEEGMWLEVPVLKGQSVMFGSLTNDASITPLTLESVQRWTEEHRQKKGGFGRRSKTSHSEHHARTQTVVQPEIVSQTDLLTQAPEGTLNLHAAKVLVAGNWTVVAQTFGMEAATALQERYSRVSRSSRSGFGVKTSSSITSLESHEETVPPIMQIGGNLYLYCDDAHFEAIHGFVGGDVLSTAQKVTLGAHVIHHRQETHLTSKGPFMESKSGRVSHSTRSTLSQLDVQGRFQGPEDSVVEITGPRLPEGMIQGSRVVHKEPEHTDAVTSYNHTRRKNQEILGATVAATAIVGGVAGGYAFEGALLSKISAAVVAGAVGPLTSTVLQDSRFDGGALVLSIGKSVATAAATFGVSSALELPARPTDFPGHLRQAAVDQAVHATVDIATGENPQTALQHAAIGVVTQSVGATLANKLAGSYHAGNVGYGDKIAGHLAIGAAMGFATGGKEGAISGGTAAVVAEVAADAFVGTKESFKTFAAAHPDLSAQEAAHEYLQQKQPSLLGPKLLGLAAGALIGKDPDAASTAASNALNNNWSLTVMMEAERRQMNFAERFADVSLDFANFIKDSPEMRELFLLIAQIRTELGLPFEHPLLSKHTDDETLFNSVEGNQFLYRHPDVYWCRDNLPGTAKLDFKFESPSINLNAELSEAMGIFPWAEETLSFVTEAAQIKIRGLCKWAGDTFDPKPQIEDLLETVSDSQWFQDVSAFMADVKHGISRNFFGETREELIMRIQSLRQMPNNWRPLLKEEDHGRVKGECSPPWAISSGSPFSFGMMHTYFPSASAIRACERRKAYDFILEDQKEVQAKRDQQKELVPVNPTRQSGLSLFSDYKFIKYFPVGGHVPEPTEHFGNRPQIELPQGVSLFLKDLCQELSKMRKLVAGIGFDRKPREQAQRDFLQGSQDFYMAKYRFVAGSNLFYPAKEESPQPQTKKLSEQERQEKVMEVRGEVYMPQD